MKHLSHILLIAIASILFSSCQKELDFKADKYYGVREFLESKNMEEINEGLYFENEDSIKLEGIIDSKGLYPEEMRFFIHDKRSLSNRIEIRIDSSEAVDIIAHIINEGGEFVKLKGTFIRLQSLDKSDSETSVIVVVHDVKNIQINR